MRHILADFFPNIVKRNVAKPLALKPAPWDWQREISAGRRYSVERK
jgi:hypothetical protein